MGLFMVGMSGRMVPAMAMILGSIEPHRRGSFMSVQSSVQHISGAIGAYVGGLIVAEAADKSLVHFDRAGWLAAALTAVSLVLAARIRPLPTAKPMTAGMSLGAADQAMGEAPGDPLPAVEARLSVGRTFDTPAPDRADFFALSPRRSSVIFCLFVHHNRPEAPVMKRRILAAFGIGMVASVCLAADKADVEKERAKLQGTWQLVSAETDGKPTPGDVCAKFRVMIAGEKFSVRFGDEVLVHDVYWDIDPTTDPKSTTDTISDGPDKGKKIRGIYRLEGDKLTTCAGPLDGPRPTEFTGKAGQRADAAGAPPREGRGLEGRGHQGRAEAVRGDVEVRLDGVRTARPSPRRASRIRAWSSRATDSRRRATRRPQGTFSVDPTVKPKTIDIILAAGERGRRR